MSKKNFNNRKLPKTQDYDFRISKDGYLVFKRQYTTRVRSFLVFLRKIIKLIIDLREKNGRINRLILDDLGVDSNVNFDQLDGFYKREFRKRKYVYFLGKKEIKKLREPNYRNFSFYGDLTKKSTGAASAEFFESFKTDEWEIGEETRT